MYIDLHKDTPSEILKKLNKKTDSWISIINPFFVGLLLAVVALVVNQVLRIDFWVLIQKDPITTTLIILTLFGFTILSTFVIVIAARETIVHRESILEINEFLQILQLGGEEAKKMKAYLEKIALYNEERVKNRNPLVKFIYFLLNLF